MNENSVSKLRVFVSSVEKELENERVAVAQIITTDPFLSAHCTPVLYEYEPASPEKALEGCLRCVGEADIYLILIWNEYGHVEKGLSITYHEYRRAKKRGIPILVFIKGSNEARRDKETREKLLKEIRADEFKYKRFANYKELQTEVRAALVRILKKDHGIEPTSDENEFAEDSIEAASDFGARRTRMPWADVRKDLARKLVAQATGTAEKKLTIGKIKRHLLSRGMLWQEPDTAEEYATAAAVVLLAKDPSVEFSQCRIMAEAYRAKERTGKSSDFAEIHDAMPIAIEKALSFVQKNTRHPMRVVGLNRVQLDEYPVEALREALVNAVAHRKYEMEGQKIFLTVYSNCVVIASPGLPPKPVTIAKLKSGKYRPCSRNSLIAQNLSFFHRIDELGGGIGRMKAEMLDHGLDPPDFGKNTGFLEVTLPGPGDDTDRLRVRVDAVGQIIEPSVEAQFNERQKQIVALLIQGEQLTNAWCREQFGVSGPTVAADFKHLMSLGIARKLGAGRSTHYLLARMTNR